MIVFSNTTTFIALASIGQLPLMPRIFGKIHVAEAVIEECAEGGRIIIPDLRKLDWIIPVTNLPVAPQSVLFELDHGEKQTITLALKHKADKVIIDERIGRRIGEYLGLSITGTLGVLTKAKEMHLITSFRDAATAMQRQGIFFNTALIERLALHLKERPPRSPAPPKYQVSEVAHVLKAKPRRSPKI